MSTAGPYLSQPLTVGGIHLKNRIAMPAMGTGLADPAGFVNDETIAYYRRRAAGGVGMLTVEASLIAASSHGVGPELRLHDDIFLPGLERLATSVKEEGVPVGIQLWHPGRQTTLGEPVAPSAVPISSRTVTPRALTLDDIAQLVDSYAVSARNAQRAGFDFVEIHGAHCYLLCEFLSPIVNRRDDAYGGPLENRARFSLEVVAAIRAACGPEFPVLFRLEASEGVPGGFDIDEAAELAVWLESAGVACLSVSAGTWSTSHLTIPPMSMPRGCLVPYAARIKQAVTIPVVAAGRLDNPSDAERVLAAGQADIIAVGRGLIADPEWPRKVLEGRIEMIRPCIACNACVDLVARAEQAQCAVNAEVSRESTWQVSPAAVPRRIMVVGGGPAGMEAARLSAERGHEVSLWERDRELGGKLDVASRAPGKSDLLLFRDFQRRALSQLTVSIHTGTEVTAETIAREDPDSVIVATGASTLIPPIPGINDPAIVDAQEILMGTVPITPGERLAVVGGSATGCEAAELAVAAGAVVTIFEMRASLGAGIETITRRQMLRAFRAEGVDMKSGATVVALTSTSVTYAQDGMVECSIEVDRVALAIGWRPRGRLLADAMHDREFHVIGDADEPGDLIAALTAGADAGCAT